MRARAAARGFVFLRLCGSRDGAVKEEIRALSDLKAILYRIIIRTALHSDGFQLALEYRADNKCSNDTDNDIDADRRYPVLCGQRYRIIKIIKISDTVGYIRPRLSHELITQLRVGLERGIIISVREVGHKII